MLKELSRQQKLYLLKIMCIEFPMDIISFFIVPIALLFCNKESNNLPKIFSWFDDPDYGINGDDGWKNEHFPNGKNTTYWARCQWLWRNRIGNFSKKFFGLKVADIDPSTVVTQGDPRATYVKGWRDTYCLVTCKTKDGKEYFGLYKEIRYKGIFKNFYCRIYVGTKLMDIAGMTPENQHEFMDENDKPYLLSVAAIHPLKRLKNEYNPDVKGI
nr:MAG TPA: Envelope protein [Caudoviricetes sp.]